jgi:hypothetical protein
MISTRGTLWLGAEAGRCQVFIQELLQLVVDGKLFLFCRLSL